MAALSSTEFDRGFARGARKEGVDSSNGSAKQEPEYQIRDLVGAVDAKTQEKSDEHVLLPV
jgi:hypothetical protein